jgi:hypothetical protein
MAELGPLVEEEDPVVGQAHVSRARDTAADEAGVGDGVMGRAGGTASEDGLAGRSGEHEIARASFCD